MEVSHLCLFDVFSLELKFMSSNYLTHFAFRTKCAKASQTKECSGRFAEYFS